MGKQLQTCAAVVAGCLVWGGGGPVEAAPPPLPPPPQMTKHVREEPRVTLVFEFGALSAESAKRLEQRGRPKISEALGERGLAIVDEGELGVRVMHVRATSFDIDERDYELELRMSGEAVEVRTRDLVCEACSEQRLLSLLIEESLKLAQRYDEALAGYETPQQWPGDCDRAKAEDDPREVLRLGKLSYTGAALIGLGVSGLATGTYLIGYGGEISEADFVVSERLASYQRIGGTVVGVSALVGAVGATLLIFDLARLDRLGSTEVGVQASMNYAGLQLVHRF